MLARAVFAVRPGTARQYSDLAVADIRLGDDGGVRDLSLAGTIAPEGGMVRIFPENGSAARLGGAQRPSLPRGLWRDGCPKHGPTTHSSLPRKRQFDVCPLPRQTIPGHTRWQPSPASRLLLRRRFRCRCRCRRGANTVATRPPRFRRPPAPRLPPPPRRTKAPAWRFSATHTSRPPTRLPAPPRGSPPPSWFPPSRQSASRRPTPGWRRQPRGSTPPAASPRRWYERHLLRLKSSSPPLIVQRAWSGAE